MSYLRGAVFFLLLTVCLTAAGCSPSVICVIETEVRPDYTVSRVTRMEAYPNPRFQGQRPRLAEYFQFPPAELYDSYIVQQDKVLFAGEFGSFELLPSDLVRNTPGADAQAGNVFSFRVMDLVLFVLADFDETLTDIVASQSDGEAALTELLRLTVPEIMSVLNAKYGAKYDLSRLDSWLMNDLPAKLRRIYAGAWAIHSAKRSGVTSPGEEYEFYMFLKAEARREGLELADFGHPDMQQENIRRLKEYGLRLAQNLLVPRQSGAVTGQELASVAVDELVAAIQKAITARHGSVNAFVGKIAALVPRAFGAYLTGTMMPIYMLPETTYQYKLRVPGMIIQTNGVREIGGELVWNFTDRDLAFTGQSLWARSIFTREPAVLALGLRGFPASLADVDRLFGLCLSPNGTPREEILKALGQSVMARGTGPLEAIAANPHAADAQAARGILELFEKHRQSPAAQRGSASAASGRSQPPRSRETPAAGPEAGPPAAAAASAAHVPEMTPSLNAPIPEPDPAFYGGGAAAAPVSAAVPVPSLEPIGGSTPGAAGGAGSGTENPPIPEHLPTAPGPRQPASGGIEPPSLPPPVR